MYDLRLWVIDDWISWWWQLSLEENNSQRSTDTKNNGRNDLDSIGRRGRPGMVIIILRRMSGKVTNLTQEKKLFEDDKCNESDDLTSQNSIDLDHRQSNEYSQTSTYPLFSCFSIPSWSVGRVTNHYAWADRFKNFGFQKFCVVGKRK